MIRPCDRLVQENARLAYREAHRVQQSTGHELDDLIQVAMIGLYEAARRFDPDRGYRFSTYAIPYCRGELSRYVRDRGYKLYIPWRWRELWQRGRKLLTEGQPDRAIAAELGLKLEDWREIRQSYEIQYLPVNEKLIPAASPLEVIADNDRQLLLQRLESAIAALDSDNRQRLLYWVAVRSRQVKHGSRKLRFPRAAFRKLLLLYAHGEPQSLNKERLVRRLKNRFPEQPLEQLRDVVNAVIEEMGAELTRGNVVRLQGLGSLKLSLHRGSFTASPALRRRASKLS